MFLIVDILNEGKDVTTQSKIIKSGLSEGENPKSGNIITKISGRESNKSQACVNSTWEQLRK